MAVIDAQVHIWPDGECAPAGWSGGRTIHADGMLREMDEAGVDAAVIVPPGGEGGWSNAAALRAAQAHPDRFAVMGVLPYGEERLDLAAWRDIAGLLGVRVSFAKEPSRGAALRGEGDWIWQACEELDLPVMVNAYGLVEVVARVVAAHPRLRLIVDHLGLGPDLDVPLAVRLEPMLALAGHPNLAVKASGLPGEVDEAYPFPSLHQPVREVIAAFGAQRVFWGSDISRLDCTYADARRLFSDALGLAGQERDLILGTGLARWLRWPQRLS